MLTVDNDYKNTNRRQENINIDNVAIDLNKISVFIKQITK